MRLVELGDGYYITTDGRDIVRLMPDEHWYRIDVESGVATPCPSKEAAARQIARLRLDRLACG